MIRTTVYGKEGCFACKMALKWLMTNGYRPSYVDMEDDPDARERFTGTGVRSLPVVMFDDDGRLIRQVEGFQPDLYKQIKPTQGE